MQGRNYPDFVVKHYGTSEPYNFETLVVLPIPWSREERVDLVGQKFYARFYQDGVSLIHRLDLHATPMGLKVFLTLRESAPTLKVGDQFHGLTVTEVQAVSAPDLRTWETAEEALYLRPRANFTTYVFQETQRDSVGKDLPPRE